MALSMLGKRVLPSSSSIPTQPVYTGVSSIPPCEDKVKHYFPPSPHRKFVGNLVMDFPNIQNCAMFCRILVGVGGKRSQGQPVRRNSPLILTLLKISTQGLERWLSG